MARTAANALVLSDGFVSVGPVGTTAPTTPTATLNVAFKDVGWLGAQGFSESRNVQSTDVIAVNGALLRRVRSNDIRTFTFEAYERNTVVMGLTRPGSTLSTTSGINTTPVKAYTGTDMRAFVLTQAFGTINRRIVIPTGEATFTGTLTDASTGLSVVQFEVVCYPASDGTLYIDINDNAAES